jgi:hypothetical protein
VFPRAGDPFMLVRLYLLSCAQAPHELRPSIGSDDSPALRAVLAALVRSFERPADSFSDERSERPDIHVDAGAVEPRQICVAILDPDYGPWITAGRQHRVHHEARYAPIPVGKRMDVPK